MCKFFKLLVLCSGLMASSCGNQLFALQIEEVQTEEDCYARLVSDIIWEGVIPVSTMYGFSSEEQFPSCGYLAADIELSIELSLVTVPFDLVVCVPFGFRVLPEQLANFGLCKKAYVIRCALSRDAVVKTAAVAGLLKRLHVISAAGCLGETVNQSFYWDHCCVEHRYNTKVGFNADS